MKSISFWTLNSIRNFYYHNNRYFIRKNIRSIHSSLSSMTQQEIANALRPFIFTVHPDRFWNHPKEKNINEISLKRLNEYLDDKNDGKQYKNDIDEIITFYVRQNNTNLNNDNHKSNNKTSDHEQCSMQNKFEKINIKLNSRENVSTTVHRILSQCSLPTDHLKKFNQTKSVKRKNSNNHNDQHYQSNEWYRRKNNEYYYNKDLFDDLEIEFTKSKMEINLSEWLKENHSIAMNKLDASQPILIELTRLKQELINELKLINLEWNCDWTASHIRAALNNLFILSKQYPNDFRKLYSKTIIFSRNNCVDINGNINLNIEDVRNNWLYLIRSFNSYDYYVKNIPNIEKKLSELLSDINIKHSKYDNHSSAKKYHNQLEKYTRSIESYVKSQKFPSNWPESLAEHRLIIESDSGPLMLSSSGDFIVPMSYPITLLIKFIIQKQNDASRLIDKNEFNQEHEFVLREECIDTFQLKQLNKDDNITAEQMIKFCRQILDQKELYENYLNNLNVQVSMYYSVMNDGKICVPYNFIEQKN